MFEPHETVVTPDGARVDVDEVNEYVYTDDGNRYRPHQLRYPEAEPLERGHIVTDGTRTGVVASVSMAGARVMWTSVDGMSYHVPVGSLEVLGSVDDVTRNRDDNTDLTWELYPSAEDTEAARRFFDSPQEPQSDDSGRGGDQWITWDARYDFPIDLWAVARVEVALENGHKLFGPPSAFRWTMSGGGTDITHYRILD